MSEHEIEAINATIQTLTLIKDAPVPWKGVLRQISMSTRLPMC
jgi:hypothetical protein